MLYFIPKITKGHYKGMKGIFKEKFWYFSLAKAFKKQFKLFSLCVVFGLYMEFFFFLFFSIFQYYTMKLVVDNFISYHRNSRYSVRQRRRACICQSPCLFPFAMFYYSTDRTPGSFLMLCTFWFYLYIAYIRLENIQSVNIVYHILQYCVQ